MNDTFQHLYKHMAWADERILSVLDASDPLMEESIKLFGHIVAAEAIWLGRILSRDNGTFTPWTEFPLAEAAEFASRNAVGYSELLGSPLDTAKFIAYKTTKGDPMSSPLGDILLQVATHGSYHRGQIASRLRALGIAVPPTDYIVFSRLFHTTDSAT